MLPWTGSADQPCYLLTDQTGDGPVSRYADRVEALQLEMSIGLLDHAEPLIDDPSADVGQLRFLSAQLRTALRDTVRVAESRGERLAAYQRSQEPDESDEPDGRDESDGAAEGGAAAARQPEGDEAEVDAWEVNASDAERPGSDEPEGPAPEGGQCAHKGAESGESEEPNKSATARTNKAERSGQNGGGGGGDGAS
ncbi:hypothetical protein [Streptomyces sp. 769]|uniref:hypothetical protein n=1 Tax=Streptomyces sp. 769 TaxID=1262452 RepID=UPI000581BCB0|nr:hypothetical protein GZL_03940 [Streptomyces sp. 769]